MRFTSQEWFDRFVAALASVIAAIGEGARAGRGRAPADGWVVTMRADQGGRGGCSWNSIAWHRRSPSASWAWTTSRRRRRCGYAQELCAQAAGSMVLEPHWWG